MSDLLIKGMEMPKSCYSCHLRKRNGIDIVCPVAQERFSVADVNILFYRLDSCPIVEIPEPHGRLIDAERLKEVFHRNVASGDAFDQLIDIAPTVIPASKEE